MVRFPPLRGVIDRRILLNFRIDAQAVEDVLPARFEPRTVGGYAIGGICLLRLRNVRPRGLPAAIGLRSENAAHRIGVQWAADGEIEPGVYVPRRDTSSRLTAALGDRTFGRYGLADFDVDERDGRYDVAMRSRDGEANMRITASVADDLPDGSVFDGLDAASAYHRCAAIGYSPSSDGDRFEGVELTTDSWSVTPLAVEDVHASYFADESRFPADAVTFDNALLMRDVGHETRDVGSMCPQPAGAAANSTAVGAAASD